MKKRVMRFKYILAALALTLMIFFNNMMGSMFLLWVYIVSDIILRK